MSNARPSGNFALDVLTDTLEGIRDHSHDQWPLPFSDEAVEDIWACDWEDSVCPSCGHDMDDHDSRTITRCVNSARSTS